MADEQPFYLQLPIGEAFLGARVQRLADLLSKQGDAFFQQAGIAAPARTVSTLLCLRHRGPSSLVQIAHALNESHQLTAQRTSMLRSLVLVSCRADPKDKRRRVFALTAKGKREAESVEARCKDALRVFESLNRELDVHLGNALDAAFAALTKRSMIVRAAEVGHAEAS